MAQLGLFLLLKKLVVLAITTVVLLKTASDLKGKSYKHISDKYSTCGAYFSPFFTISLCRVGQYCIRPAFSIVCHVFSQSVFLHVSLYVVPLSLLRSASDPSPRHIYSELFRTDVVEFSAQAVAKPLYHFVFRKKFFNMFMRASFLMSSFLMWSNLVFPLAHINILTSAECNVQPCAIAGLMIV